MFSRFISAKYFGGSGWPASTLSTKLASFVVLERPVEAALVAERAVRNRADALAARGSGAVPRPDLQPVRLRLERLQAREQRLRARLHRPLHVRGALEQIGPADVADEDEVAGRRGDRLVGAPRCP